MPQHPHLQDLKFDLLAQQQRVRIITSPMQRAILTSIPLIRSYSLPRATLLPDVCEKGGSYQTVFLDSPCGGAPSQENQATPGASREELRAKWGKTHEPSLCGEQGWWISRSKGNEQDDAFEARLIRAQRWIEEEVVSYATGAETDEQPDYLVIVSHADFIDAIITKMLRLTPSGKYVFYSSNTSISHMEYEVKRGLSREETKKQLVVRVRGTNIKPVKVDAHELALHHSGEPQA